MTANEAALYHTTDRIRSIHDRFPDGIDPDFDTGLEDLEYQLVELRSLMHRQFAATLN
jgi:hypothetical protein